MLFNSYSFLLWFLPIALLGYYFIGSYGKPIGAKIWLIGASFVFYGWWNAYFVLLLVASIAFNYLLSLAILGNEERPERQRVLLTTGGVLNLAALVYYKYLFALLGFVHEIGLTATDFGSVILPLGISFFTFTQIGYLVDCQQGLVRERGLANYVLFVTFFPHLIAGPILHHREIMPQFADDATYRLDGRKLAAGFTLFVLGLVKKVALADTIAPYADAGFGHAGQLGVLGSWSTVLAYSMQLYFDFSGYSDMAVGLGAMFGVSLPINFNSPYKSAGVIDFWQRWHMTLTRYLTLLLYNPISLWITRRRMAKGLAANRRAAETPRGFLELIAFPTFVTILLAGIWHGAGLQFVVFGLLHCLYLTVNHAWRIFGPRASRDTRRFLYRAFNQVWAVALTYLSVLLAQVFFRADSIRDALRMLGGAFGLHGWELPLPVRESSLVKFGPISDFLLQHRLIEVGSIELYNSVTKPLLYNIPVIIGLALLVWGTPNTYQILGTWNPSLQKVPPMRWRFMDWQPNLAWSLSVGVMLFFVLTRLDHPGRFLYFQF
jgi:D-alanyl-lipoteichoic acid acyltransferase DltB (MBOAT superfamily)